MSERSRKRVIIGEVAGVYGVRGWLRIRSYTDPIDNILMYSSWQIGSNAAWPTYEVVSGRRHGPGLVAKIAGVDDRDAAARLLGCKVAVLREQLPPSGDEIYWADLEGMEVVSSDGVCFGEVDYLIETGANDVLVVKGDRERLIPYIRDQVVTDIDLDVRRITVNWDPDF